MIAYYDNQPSKLEKIGNGSYFYRFNIQKIQQKESDKDQWQCDEVIVWEPLTSNNITKAVITEKWDNNYEQKLINDFNSVKLGINTDESKVETYTNYLKERQFIKEMIDLDCSNLNIK